MTSIAVIAGRVLLKAALITLLLCVGVLIGTLIAVDPQVYGPVDRLEYNSGKICKVYERDLADVYICGNRLEVRQ